MELNLLTTPWLFSQWGMDILDYFPMAPENFKFLIIVVDYCIKWVQMEASTKITTINIHKFFKWNIFARYGIPQSIVTDNEMYFTTPKNSLNTYRSNINLRQYNTLKGTSNQRPSIGLCWEDWREDSRAPRGIGWKISHAPSKHIKLYPILWSDKLYLGLLMGPKVSSRLKWGSSYGGQLTPY